MADAQAMQKSAIARLEAGDWRDAAEKAWCAARNATKSLVLKTGIGNTSRSTNIDAGIRALAKERGGPWIQLRQHYSKIAHRLHVESFYDGIYSDDLSNLVHGVTDFICLAEELRHVKE